MKRLFYLTAAVLALQVATKAQGVLKPRALKKTPLKLEMALTAEDDMPGTRGASVVWHPVQKKYYAAMAGNIGYPLSVFSAVGKRISPDDHLTEADTRGLWYHPLKKAIQGNAYGENGWFQYTLKPSGMVQAVEAIQEGQHQPDGQSVGAFLAAKKQVLFLKGSQVYFYNGETAEVVDSVAIHWGRKKADGPAEEEDIFESHEDYNYTTVLYVGIKGAELGLLNVLDKQVELYDMKTGYLTQVLRLPDDTPCELSFNTAYSNGMYWFFDMEGRTWYSYK